MIEGFEYIGQWWIPNEPENKISGSLKYNHTGGAVLVLRLPENSITKYKLPEPSIILGKSYNNENITLNNCRLIQILEIFGELRTCVFWAELVFVGVHFQSTKDIKFKSIDVAFSYFDEWVDISGFTFSHSKDEDVIIKYKRPEDIQVDIGGNFNIAITTKLKGPAFARTQKAANVEQQWIARIESSKETSYEAFTPVTQHFQNFLCLAVREPVQILDIKGKTDTNRMSDINYYPPVGIFYKSPYISELYESLLGWDMLFTYRDICDDFDMLLKNWYKKRDLLKPICGLYFGTLYNPHLYLENQLLSLVQAVEAFHERIYGGTYLPDSDYKERVFLPLVNAIPEVNQDLKESLRSRLRYGNEYYLRTRVQELIDKCGNIVPQLLGNRKVFISKTIDTRNYLTHYDQALYKRASQGSELVTLTRKLKVLLEVCLLTQTGLDANKAKDLFGKHRAVREEAFGHFPIKPR